MDVISLNLRRVNYPVYRSDCCEVCGTIKRSSNNKCSPLTCISFHWRSTRPILPFLLLVSQPNWKHYRSLTPTSPQECKSDPDTSSLKVSWVLEFSVRPNKQISWSIYHKPVPSHPRIYDTSVYILYLSLRRIGSLFCPEVIYNHDRSKRGIFSIFRRKSITDENRF